MAVCFQPAMATTAPWISTRSSGLPRNSKNSKSSFFNAGTSTNLLLGATNPGKLSKITMRVGSKTAYICRDCGYIYNERTPFSKLPDDYFCKVCGAPKRRFRPYEDPVAKNVNDTSVRKARKQELKKSDSTLGAALPVGVAVVFAVLIGTYLYLSKQF